MTELSMNRIIHGAVRRDLARFLDALDSFRDGDRDRAEQLGQAWDNFLGQLSRHHHGEHEIIWPVLQNLGVDPGLLAQMDAEHDRLAEALTATDERMGTLRTTASVRAAAAAREAMSGLRTVAEEHLAHEEADLEPLYAARKDDPALKETGRKLAGNSPTVAGQFLAWVSDGASPEEQAALRHHVPGPVVLILGGIFGRRYRRQVASVWH